MKIGRFEIHRELGRGNQSVVYLGTDPQLQREVAIKTLHFSKHSQHQNKNLLAEARMVSKLRHPNIVPIFDAGEEDGDTYLVFEYVPGKSLAEHLRENGPIPVAKACMQMHGVLDAIAAAHAQGIIHRDLKPSNIILDENGIPRVMDFGIAIGIEDGTVPGERTMSGTPCYMSPEYIASRVSKPSNDIFAAGLVLFEMLSGQRAVSEESIPRIIYRLANEDVRLPQGHNQAIDDSLADILYKALARDPQMRYPSAEQFADALDRYLEPNVEENESQAGHKQSTLDFLLRRMRHKTDFPALSESVSAINRIASSETESINKLSNTILKDFALTNTLLKLVNTVCFRPVGGGSISTVSSAVTVLGLEAVRNVATSVLLFEHMQNKNNIEQLTEELLRCNLAGVLAKHISPMCGIRDVEQAYICALFQNLGRLLVQFYFPEESDEIRRISEKKHRQDEQSAIQVLGISYESIGVAIAEQWGFPSTILRSMHKLGEERIDKPTSHEAKLQALTCFSNELCTLVATPNAKSTDINALLGRYSNCLHLDENALREISRQAVEELSEFANAVRLNVKHSLFGRQMWQFIHGSHAPSVEEKTYVDEIIVTMTLAPGKLPGSIDDTSENSPATVQALLSAGTQEISNALVGNFKLNDVLHIILETIYRAMNFKNVVLCIRDAGTNSMQGRFGFGTEAQTLVKKLQFKLGESADVFGVATSKGTDLLISNVDDPTIEKWIPTWYRRSVTAHTFMLFPLIINNKPIAMIYADKYHANSIDLPEQTLTLLRTLRNQALLAIKHGS